MIDIDTAPLAMHELNYDNPNNRNQKMQDLIIIEPGRRERHYWLELWRYRELFMVLAWRDFRYATSRQLLVCRGH